MIFRTKSRTHFGNSFEGKMKQNVTKLIRKGGKPEKNYEILRRVKNEFPEAFTFGNLIVGLAGDSEKNVVESCKKLVPHFTFF